MAIVKSYKDIGKATHVMFTLPALGDPENAQAGDLPETLTYMVRGFTPRELWQHRAIMQSIEPPMAPVKKRSTLTPTQTGKLDVANIGEEDYQDFNDPTYIEQLELFKHEMNVLTQRGTMYALMVCVEGLDLTDEEIKSELKVDPHPKEPLDSLMLRLDQLCMIIMVDFDMSHMTAIRQKINELSGMGDEQVNFT